ncbi:flagellar hook-basal body complex protein FliE [Ralstonia pickettii]|nr:flagellar hook-basal body complex protein FliE [Ralstonia pickettii]
MTWEAIQAVAQAGQAEAASDVLPATAPMPVAAPAGQFGDMVNQGLAGVNQQLLVSQTDLQQLAAGDVQNLHQVMIRLEESRLSFQLLLQVRNRLLEAYQDVMKMQV